MILSFQLTMPNVGSWDGKWTGSGSPYFRFITLSKKDGIKFMAGEKKKNYHYSWSDGLGANVKVKIATSQEKRKLEKIRIGQEVVCIKGGFKAKIGQITGNDDPKYNEIVIIKGYDKPEPIGEFVILEGYTECSYAEKRFAPILENLDEIKETLYEKVPQDSKGTHQP